MHTATFKFFGAQDWPAIDWQEEYFYEATVRTGTSTSMKLAWEVLLHKNPVDEHQPA